MLHQLRGHLARIGGTSRLLASAPFETQLKTRVTQYAAMCTCKVMDQTTLFQHHHQLKSHITTSQSYSTMTVKPSMMVRIREGLGLKKTRFKKYVLRMAGLRLYLCNVELVDYAQFFNVLQLEDTFASWFRVTELHIWLTAVRLAAEGQDGVLVRNHMMKSMWEDVDKRTRKLGPGASMTARKEGIEELSEQFRASMFSYDEGLISDDKVLAGALWRNFFSMDCKDARQLEILVQYVRKQIAHIESQDTELILRAGLMTLLPITGEEEDEKRTRSILNMIIKRS